MKIEKTGLAGVLVIRPEPFSDHRGYYLETYNEELYRACGIDLKFVQDDVSVSKRSVLRGIHGDFKTWKLISCLYGEFCLVVLQGDPQAPDFGKWQAFTLSEDNHLQVLVPPGFGNGHCVLSERTIFHYKQTTYYDPRAQFTYRWDDPRFQIRWPVREPVVSERDRLGRWPDPEGK